MLDIELDKGGQMRASMLLQNAGGPPMRLVGSFPLVEPVEGEKEPYGWPQGTGVRLTRTAHTLGDQRALALLLAEYGCHPKTGMKAARSILEDGFYDARLMTSVALSRALHEDLWSAGVAFAIEDRIPDGNSNHALHPRNARKLFNVDRNTSMQPYPGDIRPMFNSELNGLEPDQGIKSGHAEKPETRTAPEGLRP